MTIINQVREEKKHKEGGKNVDYIAPHGSSIRISEHYSIPSI